MRYNSRNICDENMFGELCLALLVVLGLRNWKI